MPDLAGHYRLRSGTDAARQAATIHVREPHFTGSDRKEFWVGSQLIAGQSYHAFAPNPAGGGYTVSTTLDWVTWYRNHSARIAPVEYSGNYTHTVILPAGVIAPRNGDRGVAFVVLPACVSHTVTLDFRNNTSGGTQIGQLATVLGEAVRKWRMEWMVTGGAWELIAADELLIA